MRTKKKKTPKHYMMCVFCPNIKDYPDPLADQPGSLIESCPLCEGGMWISKKKREIRDITPIENLWLACYECFTKKALSTPGFFNDSTRVNL